MLTQDLNFAPCHFCLFANIWFFITNQGMFTIIFTIFLASIVQSIFIEYWGGKANLRIGYIETKWYIKPTKFGYYRVVKKISHILQVDVESENRVTADSLMPNCIYFWIEH